MSSFQLFTEPGHFVRPSQYSSAPLLPIQPSPQSNLLFIPVILHSSKKEIEQKKRLRMKFFSELSWTKPFICLSHKNPMIHILLIWRCHGVKICLAEERTTRAIPLYHILSYAIQPQAHNSRKTAWNSCLPEFCLLNVSCLTGSWNNRWIKGSRKNQKKNHPVRGQRMGAERQVPKIARKLILFL